MMRIAILGATSHVAKNLVTSLHGSGATLILFARNVAALRIWLSDNLGGERQLPDCLEISNFPLDGEFDGIVNCVGFGTPEKLKQAGSDLFQLTEYWDNLVLRYLQENRGCVYVNFSSGAIYGTDHDMPIDAKTRFVMPLNKIDSKEHYRIAKLNSEAKHRACEQLSIWDIRLFNFFSRHIDIDSTYLITEMLRAIRDNKVFVTNSAEIVRDYIDPRDLSKLVQTCLSSVGYNRSVDTRSLAPISKSEMINLFSHEYGMKVTYSSDPMIEPLTGKKSLYYSTDRSLDPLLGWSPAFCSHDTILIEAKKMVESWNK